MPNQNLFWKEHKQGGYQLENLSGIKVWLSQGRTQWVLLIGDNDTEIAGEKNRSFMPGHFDLELAQRIAVGRAVGYLQDLIRQLEAFVR